jgi:L-fuconolactonase
VIDSHHHFWKYKPADFPWIGKEMEVLQHDHKVPEFEDELEFSGIDQVISIQARRTDRENHFLIDQARKSDDLVAAIVGWAPLESPNLRVFLDQYANEPLMKGIREMIAGTPDEQFLNNADFDCGIQELTLRGLTYDLLITHDQLPATIALVDRHPNQHFVLNHFGKPPIKAGEFPKTWARNIRELARRPHVYCKLSGLCTEVQDAEWNSRLFQPYFDTVLKAFGPARIMYGSDWPVCKLNATYPMWLNAVDDLIIPLSDDEKDAIRQGTAIDFYQI